MQNRCEPAGISAMRSDMPRDQPQLEPPLNLLLIYTVVKCSSDKGPALVQRMAQAEMTGKEASKIQALDETPKELTQSRRKHLCRPKSRLVTG